MSEENFSSLRLEIMREAQVFAERAHPIYKLNQWTWAGDHGTSHVPTVSQIVEQVNSLAHNAMRWAEHGNVRTFPSSVSSGRIKVTVYNYYTCTVALVPFEQSITSAQEDDGLCHIARQSTNNCFMYCGLSNGDISYCTEQNGPLTKGATCEACQLIYFSEQGK